MQQYDGRSTIPAIFFGFVRHEGAWDEYIRGMAEPFAWRDKLTLKAVCDAFGVIVHPGLITTEQVHSHRDTKCIHHSNKTTVQALQPRFPSVHIAASLQCPAISYINQISNVMIGVVQNVI